MTLLAYTRSVSAMLPRDKLVATLLQTDRENSPSTTGKSNRCQAGPSGSRHFHCPWLPACDFRTDAPSSAKVQRLSVVAVHWDLRTRRRRDQRTKQRSHATGCGRRQSAPVRERSQRYPSNGRRKLPHRQPAQESTRRGHSHSRYLPRSMERACYNLARHGQSNLPQPQIPNHSHLMNAQPSTARCCRAARATTRYTCSARSTCCGKTPDIQRDRTL